MSNWSKYEKSVDKLATTFHSNYCSYGAHRWEPRT